MGTAPLWLVRGGPVLLGGKCPARHVLGDSLSAAYLPLGTEALWLVSASSAQGQLCLSEHPATPSSVG